MSLRRRLLLDPTGPGEAGTAGRLGDVVGELVSLEAAQAVLATGEGLTVVALAAVVAARLAPPSTADELAVEAVAARGWRAAETGQIGGWLLRASGGYTGRGNSVLPLGQPRCPLPEALDRARHWYAERGLPLRLQVPTEARRLLDAALAEEGWDLSPDVHVLTARLDMLAAPPTAGHAAVSLATAPSAEWLATLPAARDGVLAVAARQLLVRHDTVRFASISDGGMVLARGRGVVDDGWLGVTAVAVGEGWRRRGLATRIMASLCAWGRAQGASHGYLQVSSENDVALAWYERLGYWRHHAYRYRYDPQSAGR